MNRKRVRVTSVDNPFDPFAQFDEWYAYDRAKGYYLSERLARVALTSDLLSDDENEEIIEEAIDEMIKIGAIDKQGNVVELKKVYED